jgi:hypothetical protein
LQAFSTTGTDGARAHRPAWQGDLALAVAGALGSLLLSLTTGSNKLLDSGGESDSLMRLVQIRDLLAGQGWFDLTQYRMGPAGGFEMHWSRLVDAPLAALLQTARMMTGDAQQAETVVAYVWPGLLLAICLFLLMRAARRIGGSGAAFPAAMLGLAALHFMGIFAPGSFDHHNVQLALILGGVTALVSGSGLRGGLLAGIAATASLAVGMETAPLVAAIGAAVALAFLFRGPREAPMAFGFGAGFAAAALLASLATLPPSRWLTLTCDAWSGAQAGTAIIAGAGLAMVAMTPSLGSSLPRRLAALGALAGALALYAAAVLPACLADPYAGLDPLLRRYWLDWVTEAQGAGGMIAGNPGEAAGYYVTPLIALAFLGAAAVRGAGRRNALVVGLVLAAAFAVSIWQVRGAMFAVPLAIIPLAAMIARARTTAARGGGSAAALILAAAWLVSFNIAWNIGVTRLVAATSEPSGAVSGDASPSSGSCYRAAAYAGLAAMEPATVLAISNLGAPILLATGHRVMSGPYHRNVEGNLAALRALTGEPDTARTIIDAYGIGFVAHCPGNSETKVLASEFPRGLIAALEDGNISDWLTPVADGGEGTLRIFRVSGRRTASFGRPSEVTN